ncbi:MAG: hypothetical protein LUO98_02640 [Methanoregula sp.]|nr:hypothetical protein [Methanoregula sp.]
MNRISETSVGSAFAAGIAVMVAIVVVALVAGIMVVTGTDGETAGISETGITGGFVVITCVDGFEVV